MIPCAWRYFFKHSKIRYAGAPGKRPPQEHGSKPGYGWLLTQEGKDIPGCGPDAGDGDKEDHEDEDRTLKMESKSVWVKAGEGL